jgi:hypothetical protein
MKTIIRRLHRLESVAAIVAKGPASRKRSWQLDGVAVCLTSLVCPWTTPDAIPSPTASYGPAKRA